MRVRLETEPELQVQMFLGLLGQEAGQRCCPEKMGPTEVDGMYRLGGVVVNTKRKNGLLMAANAVRQIRNYAVPPVVQHCDAMALGLNLLSIRL